MDCCHTTAVLPVQDAATFTRPNKICSLPRGSAIPGDIPGLCVIVHVPAGVQIHPALLAKLEEMHRRPRSGVYKVKIAVATAGQQSRRAGAAKASKGQSRRRRGRTAPAPDEMADGSGSEEAASGDGSGSEEESS